MKMEEYEAENNALKEVELARKLVNDFCEREYESSADFEDPARIGIGYTTITDREIPVEAYANLVDFCIERYLDGRLMETRQYRSLHELIVHELRYLDFSDLVYVPDEAFVQEDIKQMEVQEDAG